MATQPALAPPRGRVYPKRILIGALVIVVIGAAATLFGWDISGWFKHVWNTITTISVGYLIAAIVLITVQTVTTAFAWYSILRFAYPDSSVSWIEILACYAAAVALNFILPANLGTLVMMLMFTTIIAAATFAGILAGYVVQKVFYTLIGTAGYVYLFLSVGGSFDLQLGFVKAHPWATVILFVAGLALSSSWRGCSESESRSGGSRRRSAARSSPTRAPTWHASRSRRRSAGWRCSA